MLVGDRRIDLDVACGELVGLVTDGATAHALEDVLALRRQPDGGTITVCGIAVGDADDARIRCQMIVAPHRADLFDGSISDNVRTGAISDAEVRQALDRAAAGDLVARCRRHDSQIGESGCSSGRPAPRVTLAGARRRSRCRAQRADDRADADQAAARGVRAAANAATLVVTTSPAMLGVCDRAVARRARRRRGHARRAAQPARLSRGDRVTARSQPMTGEVPGQLPIADGRAVVAEVLRSLAGLWAQVAGAALLLTIAAGTGLVMPVGLGRIVGQRDAGTATSRVLAIGAIILAGIAVSAVVGAWGTTLSTRLFDRVVARLRERVVERALLLPQATIERAGSGDLVARAGSDVATIGDGLSSVLPTLTATVFGFVVTIAGLAVLDWRLLVVLLAIYLPLTVTALRYFPRAAPGVGRGQRARQHRSNRVISTYRGIETVTASASPNARWTASSRPPGRWCTTGCLTRLIYSRMLTRLSVAEVLSLAALGVAFWLVREGHSTLGAATASVLLLYRLFEPTMQALSIANQLQAAVASLARARRRDRRRCARRRFGAAGDDQPGRP